MDSELEIAEGLAGQFLIAMPNLDDPNFKRTVVCVCAHSKEGTIGLIVNRTTPSLNLSGVLEQLDIDAESAPDIPVHIGGPVETGVGFILHSADYSAANTVAVTDGVQLTTTTDILVDIGAGRGPKRAMLALGFSGWGPGQLENEMHQNSWLTAPADPELVFGSNSDTKWKRAIDAIGIDPFQLSDQAGHA